MRGGEVVHYQTLNPEVTRHHQLSECQSVEFNSRRLHQCLTSFGPDVGTVVRRAMARVARITPVASTISPRTSSPVVLMSMDLFVAEPRTGW